MPNNYLLHNLMDYKDKEFRKVILYCLKNRGYFQHLRDKTFSSLNIYDVNDWKRSEKYLQEEYKRLKALEHSYQAILDNVESYLAESWQKEQEKAETYRQCRHSYHHDVAEQINDYPNKFSTYLTILHKEQKAEDNQLVDCVVDELKEILETAVLDMKQERESDGRSVQDMHEHQLPDYESWKKDKIDDIKRFLKRTRQDITDTEQAIADCCHFNREVEKLFEMLDRVDSRFAEVST